MVRHVFLGVAAFLVGDDDTALGIEHGKSARHRFVVGEMTVAVQFRPTGETALDIIERERPLHVPRNLDALPRAQISVNLAARVPQLGPHPFYFPPTIYTLPPPSP